MCVLCDDVNSEHTQKKLNSKTKENSGDIKKCDKLASYFQELGKKIKNEFLNFKFKNYKTFLGAIQNVRSQVYILNMGNIKK